MFENEPGQLGVQFCSMALVADDMPLRYEASWGWYWVWQCCGSPLLPDSPAGTWRYCSGSFGDDKIGECRRFPSDDMGQTYEKKCQDAS